jgi:hypothetical protein
MPGHRLMSEEELTYELREIRRESLATDELAWTHPGTSTPKRPSRQARSASVGADAASPLPPC